MVCDRGLFREDLTFIDWDVADAQELFERLNDVLLPAGLVAPTWLDAVAARERVYPTGIFTATAGVAVPHADPPHTLQPFIAVVRPQAPVAFRAMAGLSGTVPAELVVALGFTNPTAQVGALQHLMNVFLDDERLARALAAPAPAELASVLAG